MADLRPRKTPCASCPFRRDVPSGVWSAAEYDKLASYDGQPAEQAAAGALGVFLCHQAGDTAQVCAGWAAVCGHQDCLALRLASSLDPDVDVDAVLDYTAGVPLFGSGAEAAEHGKAEIRDPSPEARATSAKVVRTRALRGQPVDYG